jgi:hypothetical protein
MMFELTQEQRETIRAERERIYAIADEQFYSTYNAKRDDDSDELEVLKEVYRVGFWEGTIHHTFETIKAEMQNELEPQSN